MNDLIERILKSVEEVGECWEWQGCLQSRSPVPTMRFQNKVKPVRRFIAEAMGKDMRGKVATYKCGNELCVHPDHVEVITRQKLQKRVAKAAQYHSNPVRLKKLSDRARQRSKLTPEIVEAVRTAEGTQRQVAARFGITQATVSAIRLGKTWRDYTNPFTALIGGLSK